MVMPRSRSRSMSSRNCDDISRFDTVPVRSRRRSASVDLPWSMCAMIEKLRMCAVSRGGLPGPASDGPYGRRGMSATIPAPCIRVPSGPVFEARRTGVEYLALALGFLLLIFGVGPFLILGVLHHGQAHRQSCRLGRLAPAHRTAGPRCEGEGARGASPPRERARGGRREVNPQ